MKPTSIASLIVAAALGTGAGFLVDQILTGAGRATFTPSLALPLLLLALTALVLALAIPIGRALRGAVTTAINPFVALRVVMLAKASSVLGAVFTGFALGLLLFVWTRPVSPQLTQLGTVVFTVVAGIVLVIGALIAERLCTIPKDGDDDNASDAGDGFDAHGH